MMFVTTKNLIVKIICIGWLNKNAYMNTSITKSSL